MVRAEICRIYFGINETFSHCIKKEMFMAENHKISYAKTTIRDVKNIPYLSAARATAPWTTQLKKNIQIKTG